MSLSLSPQQCAFVASLWLDAESHRAAELVLRHFAEPIMFPRDLEMVAMLQFPFQIKAIQGLSVNAANHWFLSRGSARAFEGENRLLHGCCYIDKGHATIFVDANDSADERRFTVAHELAHYLLDHLLPRQAAIAHFGAAILPVLNGERSPTIAERFRSVLMRLPIGSAIFLMERARDPLAAYEVTTIENRADRLALALLAPADVALANLPNATYGAQMEALQIRLREEFGLPAPVAALYADALLMMLDRAPARFSRQPQA